jgi:hypothetical protein
VIAQAMARIVAHLLPAGTPCRGAGCGVVARGGSLGGDGSGARSAGRGRISALALALAGVLALFGALGQGSALAAGPPAISEVRALDASQTTATVEAALNPEGVATTYRFEWGSSASYGNQTTVESAGSGTEPVHVSAQLTGLSPQTRYHYRLVASGSEEAESGDRELETLDSCGLPAGRCFEMVSPPEVGLVGTPGYLGKISFKAATSGAGALAYTVQNGLPDATSGGEVLYEGLRDSAGWTSAQVNPPLDEPDITVGGASRPSQVLAMSDDLSCSLVTTSQLLTPDPATRPQVEAGGYNLYRRNPNGTYSAISDLVPLNRGGLGNTGTEYRPGGMSAHCGKVVFASEHVYPGVAGEGRLRLYEWEGGTLRNVGIVPGPSGEQPVEATGVPDGVSADGSKVFFTATSQVGNDSGSRAVFVRLNGTETLDISQSLLASDTGAVYQGATSNGSRVFFTANAGLTAETSSTGTDLYEYDFDRPEGERLADLSVTHEAFGAAVAGMVGASADGSVVYFAARGQLVPGKGKTYFENLIGGTYSLYLRSGSGISYVGSFKAGELARVTVPTQIGPTYWSSRVSADGRYLLFESSVDLTGYQSGGLSEAYLFDADAAGMEPIVCVSCVPGGNPSVASARDRPLVAAGEVNQDYEVNNPQSLVERTGEARAYFRSPDQLASGATEGATNLYEWAGNQVFLLATEPPKVSTNVALLSFAGAGADGTDVYLATPESLTWEDRDERSSVYDARIGGGFQQPPAPPAPCNPTGEGSCQRAPAAAPATSGVGSTSFVGPGNEKHHKKKHKRKHKKHKHKKKHKKNKHKKGGRARHAHGNRRAGK